MSSHSVYSICGMCTVRCPIRVDVKDGRIRHIFGNPHALGGLQLCPRGAAGKAFEYDDERPQAPLMRKGPRGSGQWKKVSWEDALDFVAEKLRHIKTTFGPRAVVMSDRGGPHGEFHKAFLKAFGSPNMFNHHATCSNSVHNAHMSIAGLARNEVVYDYSRCRHLLAFGRNLLESLGTQEANDVIDLLTRGDRFTFFDVRWNITASKASSFHLVKPGSDYAIALALIHVLFKEQLLNDTFVKRWVKGWEALKCFVEAHTPEQAEAISGVDAHVVRALARDLASKAPHVIVHPGWMTAWTEMDYYLRRALYALNALLGSYESTGGLALAKGARDVGLKLRSLVDLSPTPETQERFDGIGTTCQHLGKQWGLAQRLPEAVLTGQPYPIKAYLVMRHDPMASLPDPEHFRRALEQLDLLLSIDVNYSATGWYSDVILPEATYLERTDAVIVRSGLKPKLALRRQAIAPRFDSRPRWWIFKQLANRLELGQYFPYETIEDHIAWQLAATPYTLSDFDATGEVKLSKEELWWDRAEGLKFNTPSGCLEVHSDGLERCGLENWVAPVATERLEGDRFRLITGKVAVHTQGRTTANNPLLHELVPANRIELPEARARTLGIRSGDRVILSAGGHEETGLVELKPYQHPEVLYMLHGFGDEVPLRTRSFGQGMSDVKLGRGRLQTAPGGNCPLTETIVTVRKATSEV